MDLKTLQTEVATLRLDKSAFLKYQSDNVKYYRLEIGSAYVQKVFSTKHIKGGNNPYSVVVFIGFGTSPINLINAPYPKAIDLKSDQFYWFQTWDIATDKMVIFKAGKLNNVLGIGVGSEEMVRVTYASLIGVDDLTVIESQIEETPEIEIKVERVMAASSAEAKQEQRDKELEFWRSLQDKSGSKYPKVDIQTLEIIIRNASTDHFMILQEKYPQIVKKDYKGIASLAIPFNGVYDSNQLRTLIKDFGLDWYNDVILQHVTTE